QAVLGSMLRLNQCIPNVLEWVRAEDFHVSAHIQLFGGLVGLWDKGSPADLVTLGDWLKANGLVEDIGGYAPLGQLWDKRGTGANAKHYAEIIQEQHIARSLSHAWLEIYQRAQSRDGTAEEQLAAVERHDRRPDAVLPPRVHDVRELPAGLARGAAVE